MCKFTGGHDSVCVCIHAWAWSRLCVHIRVGVIAPMWVHECWHNHACVCIYQWAWLCLYVHRSLGTITPVCEYVQAWLRLCVHIRAGIITPMCACMSRYDCAYVGYTWRHYCIYVCMYVQVWSRICWLYMKAWWLYAWACSRLCVHTCVGMFAPMCAYICGQDLADVHMSDRVYV